MAGQSDTLNDNNPPSGDPPPAPPETPPGQQTGGQGQAGDQTNPPPPAPQPGQQAGDPGGDGDTITITLSQEKLDERIEQAGRSSVRAHLESLGFADLDDDEKIKTAQTELKGLLDFAREQKRDQMTAEQRVQADLKQAKDTAAAELTKRETAEQERDAAQIQLREYILRSTITGAAQQASHPSDVYDLYARVYAQDKLGEVIKKDVPLFGEDGVFNAESINDDAVKAIIDKCREERREWWPGVFRTPGSPSNAGAQPPGGDLSKLEEQREIARSVIQRS